jgi:hypothetical protein
MRVLFVLPTGGRADQRPTAEVRALSECKAIQKLYGDFRGGWLAPLSDE